MDKIKALHKFYRLKEVDRRTSVGKRLENPAEHSWSSLMLAEYFMPKGLDALKVHRLLLFHDLVEIEAGDVFFYDKKAKEMARKKELAAYRKLCRELPGKLAKNFKAHWKEFEEGKTKESRFAQACDKLDPTLHSIFHKEHFTNNQITEAMLVEGKQDYFKEFPAMEQLFKKLLKYAKQNGYFPS